MIWYYLLINSILPKGLRALQPTPTTSPPSAFSYSYVCMCMLLLCVLVGRCSCLYIVLNAFFFVKVWVSPLHTYEMTSFWPFLLCCWSFNGKQSQFPYSQIGGKSMSSQIRVISVTLKQNLFSQLPKQLRTV